MALQGVLCPVVVLGLVPVPAHDLPMASCQSTFSASLQPPACGNLGRHGQLMMASVRPTITMVPRDEDVGKEARANSGGDDGDDDGGDSAGRDGLRDSWCRRRRDGERDW
eukprot:10968015-Alexandrium_andersonii.AAC.1